MIDLIILGVASIGVSGFGVIVYHGRKRTVYMRKLKHQKKHGYKEN